MGWGKCMEDNMDAVVESYSDWNVYGYSYSFSQPFVKSIQERNACLQSPRYEIERNYGPAYHMSKRSNQPTLSNQSQPKTRQDKKIRCKDCGQEFLFTAQKQEQYESKGWSTPKRCKRCRSVKEQRTYGTAVIWVA